MEVKLTPEEVEDIIRLHLLTKFKDVGEIKLKVGMVGTGYYTGETTTPMFTGAITKVEF